MNILFSYNKRAPLFYIFINKRKVTASHFPALTPLSPLSHFIIEALKRIFLLYLASFNAFLTASLNPILDSVAPLMLSTSEVLSFFIFGIMPSVTCFIIRLFSEFSSTSIFVIFHIKAIVEIYISINNNSLFFRRFYCLFSST